MSDSKIKFYSHASAIPLEIHNNCVHGLQDLGYKIDECRSEGDKGGPFWFPTDLIITISSHILDAVLGVLATKGFDWMIKAYKETHGGDTGDHTLRPNFFIETTANDELQIYFKLDCYDYKTNTKITDEKLIIEALMKIQDARKLIEKNFSKDTQDLFGNPHSIVMKYDFELKKWIVRQYNSSASIFFDYLFPKGI